MPVHIGELSSDVTLVSGDLPLGEAQMEKIAQFVLAREYGCSSWRELRDRIEQQVAAQFDAGFLQRLDRDDERPYPAFHVVRSESVKAIVFDRRPKRIPVPGRRAARHRIYMPGK